MLLDRRRVKFWQKIIFSVMAFLMVVFALGASVAYIGCNNSGTTVKPSDTVKKAAAQAKAHPTSLAARIALAQAWLQLARAQTQGSDAETSALNSAASAYEKYLKLQTGTSLAAKKQRLDAAMALVSIYTQLENWDKATVAYGVLTELQPDNADNYILYGEAAQKAGRDDIAILAYQKYLQLAPHGTYAKDVKVSLKKLQKQATASPSP